MKNFSRLAITVLSFLIVVGSVSAQKTFYDIKTVKQIKTTPSKDIQRTGSCWANAGTALLEAEWIKNRNQEIDLSEMTFITDLYKLKANAHVSSKGAIYVDEKGLPQDVFTLMQEYGMAPESMYMKSEDKPEKASSGEMDAIIRATLHMVMEKEGGNFTENWKNTFNASLYRYLGETRINFNYEGKDYTPKSFAAQSGLKASDFVTLTSDDKSAMDTKITLTAKNNWNKSQAYNVNPDILVSAIQSAVNNGYCTIWYGSLPDEMIYNAEKVAIVPDGKIADLTQGDETDENSFNPLPEKTITNTERQAVLETSAKTEQNYLLISGISKDKNGTEYLIAKNVCEAGDQTLHLSSAFLKLNTGFIVVNKKGLPTGLNSKLGF